MIEKIEEERRGKSGKVPVGDGKMEEVKHFCVTALAFANDR